MILNPRGIAVIGASREKEKVGHVVFKNLLKSKIKAYPVNPFTKSILGKRCYKSVVDLKGKVSHAVIAVPAKIVPQITKECGVAGIKTMFIISAGFSEAGNKALENEVLLIAKEHGVRILGPNILGVIVPGEFNTSFFEGEIKKGGVSFISQSGALGVGVLDSLISKDWGLRSFISVGNVSDLTITDALKEVLKDKGTSCVIIYAESLKDGRKFMKACEKSKKPVFILKSGITEEGVRAAATHTGSLAGTDIIYDAAFKQCNAKRVESLTELINAGITFDKYGYFHDNALIITNAGGPGILLTDALAGQGVKIPKLPKKLIEKLNIELKGISWSKNNPIDVIGDAQANRYAKALRAVSKYNFYDEVIVVLTPQGMTEPLKTAQEIVAFAQEVRKPVVTCFIGGERVKNAITYLENEGLMNFDNIHELAATIRNLFSSNF